MGTGGGSAKAAHVRRLAMTKGALQRERVLWLAGRLKRARAPSLKPRSWWAWCASLL